jgi:hypothetical protein
MLSRRFVAPLLRSFFAVLVAALAVACGNLLNIDDRSLDSDYPPGGYDGCRNGSCNECSLEYHRCRCEGRSTDVCYRDHAKNDSGAGFSGCQWAPTKNCTSCPTSYTLCACENGGNFGACDDPVVDPGAECRGYFTTVDSCAQCLCGSCGNEIAGCLQNGGCTALLDCVTENPCDFDDTDTSEGCFSEDGACIDVLEDYGGPAGRAMGLLSSVHRCLDGPATGCPCSGDPGECCSNSNPCQWDNDGVCDCPGQSWDESDCSGDCCTSSNPCGLSNDSICQCNGQPWDDFDCRSGTGIECGNATCFGTQIPGVAGTVQACCPDDADDTCGIDVATALPGWPGQGCMMQNAPGVPSDECPGGMPYRFPGQPNPTNFPGCCTPDGDCGVFVSGPQVSLGCQVDFPTPGPRPSSCDPAGIVCDFDCQNCPNCESQCRCMVERRGFPISDFGMDCMNACSSCMGEDMCGGCTDDFGECLCDGGDPMCCRDQPSTSQCSPYDSGGCGGTITERCQDCETECDSCVCNSCQYEWSRCQGDEGCLAIWSCIQETQCELCYSPDACQGVIDEYGGPQANSMTLISNLSYCSQQTFANCTDACPDACVPPACNCGDCMSQCLCVTGGATAQCELKCHGGCSPEVGCQCGSAQVAACMCQGTSKAECEMLNGSACGQPLFTCLDSCLCGGTSLDICAAEQCPGIEIYCGSQTCRDYPFYDNETGFSWMAAPCCPSTGASAGCGLNLDSVGAGFRGCLEFGRQGGENTGCPSHDAVAPWTMPLPGCCANGVCGYLDQQFGVFGCIDASAFGDTGGGC